MVSTVAQEARVTQFTVWFVPFPGLHRDTEMIRRYEVSHFIIEIYMRFCTYVCFIKSELFWHGDINKLACCLFLVKPNKTMG